MKKHLIITALLLLLMFTVTACGREKGTPGQSIFNSSSTDTTNTDQTLTPTGTESSTQTQTLAETYPIKDIITVGKYNGIEVTALDLVVTDTEVDIEFYGSLKGYVTDTDRTEIKKYDLANIDFVGKKDGVAFEGGTAEGYDLLIGSGSFIPGFEDGLIGVSVGDTVDLPLTFPDNYGSAELAGQDVVFTVTVNSIKELPEITDAFISEKTGFDTVDAYKEDIRNVLQSNFDATIETQFESDVMEAIVANSTFHMDISDEITAYANSMKSMYEYYAAMYGMSLDAYLSTLYGISLDTFNADILMQAETLQRTYYAMLAVADAENMQVSDTEYNEYATLLMEDYGYQSLEDFEVDYPRKKIENALLYERAINFVLENAIRK